MPNQDELDTAFETLKAVRERLGATAGIAYFGRCPDGFGCHFLVGRDGAGPHDHLNCLISLVGALVEDGYSPQIVLESIVKAVNDVVLLRCEEAPHVRPH